MQEHFLIFLTIFTAVGYLFFFLCSLWYLKEQKEETAKDTKPESEDKKKETVIKQEDTETVQSVTADTESKPEEVNRASFWKFTPFPRYFVR